MKKIIIALMTILLVPFVFGIGVGPAKTNILFEPNLITQYHINIYNTNNKNFEVSLKIEGELEQYLLLESQTEYLTENDEHKRVAFNVSFPKDIPPGYYSGKIIIVEKPSGEDGTIMASLGVTHDIYLEVPTHGKYIKEFIEEQGERLFVRIKNIGVKEIENLEIINKLYDQKEDYISTYSTKNFVSDEIFEFIINLNITPGFYKQNLNIIYDELSKNRYN